MKIVMIDNEARPVLNFRSDFVRLLSCLGHTVVVATPDRPPALDALCRETGARWRPYRLHRASTSALSDVQTLTSLYEVLREVGPECVINWSVKPAVYGLLAARAAFVPRRFSVLTGLGTAFAREGGALLRATAASLLRVALPSADGVVFQNRDDLDLLANLGVLAKVRRVTVVDGSGINLHAFPATRPPDGPPRFTLIARMIREKGVCEFAQSAIALKARYPDAEFQLVGGLDANPGSLGRADLAAWEAQGVRWLGGVSDVRPVLAATSVFVLPSYYREGVPHATLEAMAMARPVITTDAPGCRETVREGVNGFLVPPRDATALARAMQRFLAAPALSATMGLASRELAEERFDVHQINRELVAFMDLDAARARACA